MPDENGNARIVILNTNGKIISEIRPEKAGWNDLNANLSELPSGLYFYDLAWNGVVLQMEKLIKTN